jgi:hypothetical protein
LKQTDLLFLQDPNKHPDSAWEALQFDYAIDKERDEDMDEEGTMFWVSD